MARDIDIDVDLSRFESKWDLLIPLVRKEMKELLRSFMFSFRYDMARKRMSQQWSTPGDQKKGVGTRTGTLKREFASSVVVKGKTIKDLMSQATMGLGSSSKYAPMLEKPGIKVIKKKNKMLKVPLSEALTKAGNIKKAAQSKDLVLLIRKVDGKSTAFLGVKVNDNPANDIFYWILRSAVKIKAHLGYFDHFDDYSKKNIPKLTKRAKIRLARVFNKG